MDSRQFGQLGEEFAARYLWKHGYTVIAGNYRNKFGEIDLIASKRKTVAFIEVKTRTKNSIAEPREFVTYTKQKRIISCALSLLLEEEMSKFQPRFDVIEVIMDYDAYYEDAQINHIENAFTAEAANGVF